MATWRTTKQDMFLRRIVFNNEAITIEELQSSLLETRQNIHSIAQHLLRRNLIRKKTTRIIMDGKPKWEIIYTVNPLKRMKIGQILRNKFGGSR